jgi:hypothetical protein
MKHQLLTFEPENYEPQFTQVSIVQTRKLYSSFKPGMGLVL